LNFLSAGCKAEKIIQGLSERGKKENWMGEESNFGRFGKGIIRSKKNEKSEQG